MANVDFRACAVCSNHAVRGAGWDHHTSHNLLFTTQTDEGETLILKCFLDQRAFEVERAIYLGLSDTFSAVDHFLGETCFNGRPTLVFRQLSPIDWSGEWRSLLARAINVRRLLSHSVAQVGVLHPAIPIVDASMLLAPLRAWLNGDGKKAPPIVRRGAMKSAFQQPLELCHGDFHPPNLLADSEGRIHLVDWERCSWSLFDRDLAAIVVGIAVRQSMREFTTIMASARAIAREPELFAYLVMSEVLALSEVFANYPEKTEELGNLLENLVGDYAKTAV